MQKRQFQINDKVMVKNFRSDPTWIPGVVIQTLAPLTYLVEVRGGLKWKRHVDHPPTPEQTTPELNQNQSTSRYPSRNRQPP